MAKILVIDDDIDICNLLSRFLTKRGYEVDTAMSGKGGLEKIASSAYDLVFCDFKLRDMEGRDILTKVQETTPGLKVIIITGYSDIKTAVDVMKRGAYDYVIKPLIPDELINLINRALSDEQPKVVAGPAPSKNGTQGLKRSTIKSGTGETIELEEGFITGSCGESKLLYKQVGLVAPTNFSVIIYGESGSGKENIARTIHTSSKRKDKPFIAIDCGALTKELAGSELWGHEKGAFTGAITSKPGQFELANGGTIFLDEVANLSYETQVGLLRLVQERKLRRIGGTKDMDIDVRILVASNENLWEAAQKGKFREDLYHRFNEFSMIVPPLRERGNDVLEFALHFLQMANNELGKNLTGFTEEVRSLFLRYPWPGNLREMRNVIRRAALLGEDKEIGITTLPQEIVYHQKFSFSDPDKVDHTPTIAATPKPVDIPAAPQSLKDAAAQAEADVLKKILEEVKYNRTKAAQKLGIDRKTLFNKMKQHNL
ncbi:MAG: sigma-54-dependent Fis family transcriptional regulator [Chitinophagaceae bacterium]|nr:sigma-54-dependent Fis family transcriptional regulator [Chitinophagaceae bacterium]